MLVSQPKVLDPNESYTFRNYFELKFAAIDILADLGCLLVRQPLDLPQSPWDVAELKTRINRYLRYVVLDSEDARKQAMIAPVLMELVVMLNVPLQIEYPIKVNQYL